MITAFDPVHWAYPECFPDSQLQETDNRTRQSAARRAEIVQRGSGPMVNRHSNNRVTAADTSNPLQCRVRIIVATLNRDGRGAVGSDTGREQFVLAQVGPRAARVDQTLCSFVGAGTQKPRPRLHCDRLARSDSLATAELKGGGTRNVVAIIIAAHLRAAYALVDGQTGSGGRMGTAKL